MRAPGPKKSPRESPVGTLNLATRFRMCLRSHSTVTIEVMHASDGARASPTEFSPRLGCGPSILAGAVLLLWSALSLRFAGPFLSRLCFRWRRGFRWRHGKSFRCCFRRRLWRLAGRLTFAKQHVNAVSGGLGCGQCRRNGFAELLDVSPARHRFAGNAQQRRHEQPPPKFFVVFADQIVVALRSVYTAQPPHIGIEPQRGRQSQLPIISLRRFRGGRWFGRGVHGGLRLDLCQLERAPDLQRCREFRCRCRRSPAAAL